MDDGDCGEDGGDDGDDDDDHDGDDDDDNGENNYQDGDVSTVKISWGLLGPMGPARVDTGWGDFSR